MNLIKRSFLNALGTTAYIVLVGLFMRNVERLLGDKPDTFAAPITILLLFVLSAAITGGLVIGKPVMMFINNEKAEAVRLFMYTVGWLALATIIFLALNFAQ